MKQDVLDDKGNGMETEWSEQGRMWWSHHWLGMFNDDKACARIVARY